MSIEVSLIIASYNQTNAMEFVFESVLTQASAIDEVIIADDGSQPDTKELIDNFAARASFPVVFTTQEDAGFRKAKALNNATRESSGKYLLFLDGDCIAPPEWAGRNVDVLESGADFCTAGYVWLSLEQARSLTREYIAQGRINELISETDFKYLKKIHRKNRFYKFIHRKHKPKMLGGNWAASREAVVAVNGHDENYDGFGKEDSDIRNRLWNAGFRGKSLWDINWVFHCSHELDPRRNLPDVVRKPPNKEYFYSRRRSTVCENGLVRQSKLSDKETG